MKVQVYVKKSSDICSLWNIKFYDYESYNIFGKKFIKESFLISQDVSSLIQSCRLSDLSWNNYFVTRIFIGRLCKIWEEV